MKKEKPGGTKPPGVHACFEDQKTLENWSMFEAL
jgi:hypothetical protein